MDNEKDDKYYAIKSIDNIVAISNYLGTKTFEEFISDAVLVDAIMFRLVQLIENIKYISPEFKMNNPQVPWSKIMGFRNGLVHEYGNTDYTIVYEVVSKNLSELKTVLETVVD